MGFRNLERKSPFSVEKEGAYVEYQAQSSSYHVKTVIFGKQYFKRCKIRSPGRSLLLHELSKSTVGVVSLIFPFSGVGLVDSILPC